MEALLCVDNSELAVRPVRDPAPGRAVWPAQLTLELIRDGQPFALVGGRCGTALARLAGRLAQAREDPEQARAWPSPDDRFPGPAAGPGPRAALAATGQELFVLRSADGRPGGGELRVVLRSAAEAPQSSGVSADTHGWQLTRRAIVEAWGDSGIGVRAVLTSAELATFLDTVLSEPVTGARTELGAGRTERAGRWLGGFRAPRWRQRGRTPDGTARSGLPAVRTQA